MKKVTFALLTAVFIISSCTQDLPVAPENMEQEIVFTSAESQTGFKNDFIGDCNNSDPVYALVYLTDEEGDAVTGLDYPQEVPVFFVNDVMYTQAIKLMSGSTGMTYILEKFELYDENDQLVNAVPITGSEYGNMVSVSLPLDVTVSPFTKTEVPLSILCFDEADYEAFGFSWFRIDERKITNKYFFGDFCTKFFEDYDESAYAGMIAVDMPAIFELNLYAWDPEADGGAGEYSLIRTVDNLVEDGEEGNSGHLIELVYPTDYEEDGDLFRIDINILVKVGDDFSFESFGSWYFKDNDEMMYTNADLTEGAFDFGTDGVYDFILGNCNVDGADYVFPPYMNLPETANLRISIPASEGRTAYILAQLTGIGTDTGYDLEDGIFDAFCFDIDDGISTGTTYYNVGIYSSLYVTELPDHVQGRNWEAVNWLANNLDRFEGYTWEDLQQAIWVLEGFDGYTYDPDNDHGVPADEDMVDLMVNTSLAESAGYYPMPGGWAAVVLDAGTTIQTIFTIVDP